MRSLRLDPELDDLVRRAAAREGKSVSEFLRCAASERARRTLADSDESRDLSDVIGAVSSDGGRARQTGAAFGDPLAQRRQKR